MTLEQLVVVTVLLTGLAVGSFLNVVADRVPRGQSLLSPRSHCDACGRQLAALQLVPLLSYLWLRGRCRTCGAAIGRRTVVMELAGAAIAVGAWQIFGLTLPGLLAALYGWLFLILSVIDIEHQRVPRAMVYGGLLLALVASPWWPLAGLVRAIVGGLVAWLPYALLYVIVGRIYGPGKGMGRADVNVAALMGLVAGFPGAIIALYAAILAGAVMAIALVLTGRRKRRDPVPTIPVFAIGALISLLWSMGYIDRLLQLAGLLQRTS
jgi:leader peptidase (prepilin peptidase)/N-methyltransferase